MPHPLKKAFAGIFAAFFLLESNWGQSTISFTNSAPSTGSFANINLTKFDTALGTLTGVAVTINFVSVGGSFSVTSTDVDETTYNSAAARLIIRQATTNSLGYTQVGQTTNVLTTTPGGPFTVPGESTQAFSITSTNFLVGQSQNISSNFWSAYSSVGGAGVVTFQFRNLPQIFADGLNFTVSSGGISSTANMSVTYTYTGVTPVPEPSTVATGAFLTLVAAASYWRRRRNASAPKN